MKNAVHLIGLVIILLIACNQKIDKGSNRDSDQFNVHTFKDSVTLVESSIKYFAIDSATNYNTMYLTTYHDPNDGKRYLVYQCDNKKSIQFYNFDSGLLESEIRFRSDGPNGIPKLTGFYIVNPDSIFVLSGHARKLYIINSKGEVLKTYSLLMGDESKGTSMALITTSNEPFLIGDTLFINAFPDRSPYYKGQHIQAINLKTGEYYYKGEFPVLYANLDGWNKMSTGVYKLYNQHNGSLLSSHMGSKYLFSGSTDNTLKVQFYAGSKFFDNVAPIPLKDKEKSWSYHYLTQNYYGQVLYDQYRKVYYRIAMLAVDPLNDKNERNRIEDKPISIIILNNKLEKIGETLLSSNKYFFRTMFVEKEGLYIAATNYKNPDLKEDRLAYILLTLKVIE